MPDKSARVFEPLRQVRQWQVLRHLDSVWRQGGCQTIESFPLGFAPNEEKPKIGRLGQMLQQPGPIPFRPVFSLTSAARMQSQPIPRRQDIEGQIRHVQSRNPVGIEDGEPFERLKEYVDSMALPRFIRTMGTNDKLGLRNPRDVLMKNPVGIVKIRNDDRKTIEVFSQVGIERAVSCEKPSQSSRLNRTNLVDQTADESQLSDVRIRENFQARLRELLPQCAEHRQSQYEVANRTAANDENFTARFRHVSERDQKTSVPRFPGIRIKAFKMWLTQE